MDLVGLLAWTAAAAIEVETLKHEALKKAVAEAHEGAVARIGHDNPAVGPVPAWAPLAPTTVVDRVNRGFSPDEPLRRTGELEASIVSGIEGDYGFVGSPLEKAGWAELGTKTQPPRSYLTGGFYDREKEIAEHIGKTTIQVFSK